MKFNKKRYSEGDRRIKRWFAFLPISIYHKTHIETRWLEWITVEQVYKTSWWEAFWDNVQFINEGKEGKV